MNYYKNSYLAKQYGINPTTVTNYIKGALRAKNGLSLVKINGKNYIEETEDNQKEIERLVEKGLNYKSREERVEVIVNPELYKILNEDQLLSLYNELLVKKRIPMKLNYLGEGGENWSKVYKEAESNVYEKLLSSQKILAEIVMYYLKDTLSEFDTINFFDLGASSSQQIEPFISPIKDKKINYISIDISPTILKNNLKDIQTIIPKENIYPNLLDFEITSLQPLLYKFKALSVKSINIVLFLGATISNFENEKQIRILRNIGDGLLKEDFLFVLIGKDVPETRNVSSTKKNKNIYKCFTFIASLIGLNEENCDIEFIYNQTKKRKEVNLIAKKDVVINFNLIDRKLLIPKSKKVNIIISLKDLFTNVVQKNINAGYEVKLIMEHPQKPYIAYLVQLAE